MYYRMSMASLIELAIPDAIPGDGSWDYKDLAAWKHDCLIRFVERYPEHRSRFVGMPDGGQCPREFSEWLRDVCSQ